jgi:hypothetical protein
MRNVDEMADGPGVAPAPHHTRPGAAPSYVLELEAAMGPPEARIDWMLILESARGYEICAQWPTT